MVSRQKEEGQSEVCRNMEAEVMISLAGKAATELILGETDMGTEKDIRSAFNQVEKILDNVSAYDFYSWCHGDENVVL